MFPSSHWGKRQADRLNGTPVCQRVCVCVRVCVRVYVCVPVENPARQGQHAHILDRHQLKSVKATHFQEFSRTEAVKISAKIHFMIV